MGLLVFPGGRAFHFIGFHFIGAPTHNPKVSKLVLTVTGVGHDGRRNDANRLMPWGERATAAASYGESHGRWGDRSCASPGQHDWIHG